MTLIPPRHSQFSCWPQGASCIRVRHSNGETLDSVVNNDSIRVLIADDHAIFRDGMKRIIETTSDIVVCGTAANGDELLRMLPETDASVVLLDLSMPDVRGVELVAQASGMRPDLPILVLSMHNKGVTASRALEAGAVGYATKDSEPEDLLGGIRLVAQGKPYLSPDIATEVAMLNQGGRGDPGDGLSPREEEILRMIAQGDDLNAIARRLHISPKTVSTHKMRLMRKLGLTNNVDLVRYTMRRGLAPPTA